MNPKLYKSISFYETWRLGGIINLQNLKVFFDVRYIAEHERAY